VPDEPVEDKEERGVTRRSLLKIGVATAGGVAVGSTLGFFGGAGSRQVDIDSLNARLAAITKIYNLPPLSPSISMFNWSLYTNYALLDQFIEKFGVQLVYDETAETQEDFRTKLKQGNPDGFDIMVVTDYAVEEAISLGLIEKLNKDYIPNIDYLDTGTPTPWDPGHDYSLPYLAGTTGIGWNQNLVKFPSGQTTVRSWDQLFDTSPGGFLRLNSGPPSRVTLHADRDETLGAAAIYLGKSVNDLSPATLNEIEQTIIAAKPYLAQFADATTYYDGLLNDQFHASHAWSGDVIFVREDGSKPEIVYTVPDEGAHLWTDNFVIPKNAPNRDTAMVFINYMWEAANQAVLAMFRNYTIANRLALRGGTLDLQRNAGIPLGMVTPYVGGLPDINVLADPDDVPDRAPLLQVTQSRTEAENRTLDELWLRIQAA